MSPRYTPMHHSLKWIAVLDEELIRLGYLSIVSFRSYLPYHLFGTVENLIRAEVFTLMSRDNLDINHIYALIHHRTGLGRQNRYARDWQALICPDFDGTSRQDQQILFYVTYHLRTPFFRTLTFDFYGHIHALGCSVRDENLQSLLVSAGWCPNQYQMCRARSGKLSTIFCAHFTRHHQRTHELCSGYECRAYNIADSSTATRHVQAGCSCVYLVVPKNAIRRLIKLRRTPLIKVRTGENGNLCLEVVEGVPGSKFVAFSHVWSHGLGNPNGNSLPSCQVVRLQQLATHLVGEHPTLWIDTICIPRYPRRVRRRAIEDIRSIYEHAHKVVVLDEELQETPKDGRQFLDLLMCINLSGWMRRLWTLNEAVRSHNVLFQFKDGICDMNSMVDHSNYVIEQLRETSDNGSHYGRTILVEASSVLQSIKGLRSEKDEASRLVLLWALLRWRHTSWIEDETICMANILGLSRVVVDDLLKVPNRFRMKFFLDNFLYFPSNILFLDVPRLSAKSYRWAPASWLHSPQLLREQHEFKHRNVSIATRTYQGLLSSFPVLFLLDMKSLLHVRKHIYIQVDEVSGLFGLGGGQFTRWLKQSHLEDKAEQLVIILEDKIGAETHRAARLCRGALVKFQYQKVTSSSQGVVSVGRFLCPIEMTPSNIETIYDEEPINSLLFENQIWCIG